MGKLVEQRSHKAGMSPGVLVPVGEAEKPDVRISVMAIADGKVTETEIPNLAAAMPLAPAPAVTWINVDGLSRLDVIEMLGVYFSVHPLVQEDLLDTEQRPKLEDHDDYLFLVAKMFYDGDGGDLHIEQVSFLVGANYVISFSEDEGDVFDSLRDRIRNGKGRLCSRCSDYLVYGLLDTVVDSYFGVVERMGERIEDLEEALVKNPTRESLAGIHQLKRNLIFLRRAVWPMREVVSDLERGTSALVHEETRAYFRDVYDHCFQLMDTIETLREMVAGMLDIYLSSVSNRTNEVMKVLTIIATIFIPLTFFAGVYGMNFKYMPELDKPWAYPVLWLFMISIAGIMLLWFRKRKWL
jgi:magnesium transporter